MKSYKWVNLSLMVLLVLLGAFQATRAQAYSRPKPTSSEVKINAGIGFHEQAEDVYKRALGLAENFATKLKTQPGDWYHWIALFSDNTGVRMVYPDGTPIPSQTMHEAWYTLDQQGMIQDGFYLVKNMDGTILQQVLYRKNVAYNLTFPKDITPVEMASDEFGAQPYFDFNFVKNMRWSIDNEQFSQIESVESMVDGAPALQFSIIRDYQTPVDIAGFPAPVDISIVRAIFDTDSGESYRIETAYQLIGGDELTSSITVKQLEKLVTLPDDIQKLVDQSIQ